MFNNKTLRQQNLYIHPTHIHKTNIYIHVITERYMSHKESHSIPVFPNSGNTRSGFFLSTNTQHRSYTTVHDLLCLSSSVQGLTPVPCHVLRGLSHTPRNVCNRG